MNSTKTDPNPKNTNNPAQPVQSPAPTPAPQAAKAKTKMVSIQLSEDTHQKLRIVALSKGSSTSGLVENYVESGLKKDLVLTVAKLSE